MRAFLAAAYKVLRGMNKIKSRITILDIKRTKFEQFRDLLERIPKEVALEVKEAWENSLRIAPRKAFGQKHDSASQPILFLLLVSTQEG